MNESPKVCFIIPSFHAAHHLRHLSKKLSMESSSVAMHIEIIIIDSESSHESQMELHRLNDMFPSLITLSFDERLSPGQARNLGLKMTTSDYVAFLDVDDEYNIDGYLNLIYEMVANKYDIGIGVFQICRISPRGKSQPRTVPFRNGALNLCNVLESNIGLWRYIFRRDWLSENQLSFSNLLLGEDLLFLLDACSIDSSVLLSNEILYTYFVGWPTQASSPFSSADARVELLRDLGRRAKSTSQTVSEKEIIGQWFFRVWVVGFRNQGVKNQLQWLLQLHIWSQEGNKFRHLVENAFNVLKVRNK